MFAWVYVAFDNDIRFVLDQQFEDFY
jgi:hypothetical protein